MDDDPERTALAVLELREFRRVWMAIDQAQHQADVPTGPMAERVKAAIGVRLAARLTPQEPAHE